MILNISELYVCADDMTQVNKDKIKMVNSICCVRLCCEKLPLSRERAFEEWTVACKGTANAPVTSDYLNNKSKTESRGCSNMRLAIGFSADNVRNSLEVV